MDLSGHLRAASSILVLGAALAAAPVSAEQGSVPAPTTAAPLPAAAALAPGAETFRRDLAAETAALAAPTRDAIDGFFAARGYAPFWTEPGSGRAEALVAAIADSPAQGLPARGYDLPGVEAALASGQPEDRAGAEVAATLAYLAFAGDLSGGVVRPRDIDPEIDLRPKRPSPAALLALLETEPVPQVLQGLEPSGSEYRTLIAEKARLEGLIASDAWGAGVPEGPTLHAGENGLRIADLRARLGRMGYAAPAGAGGDAAFDSGLQAAVEAFQRDNGLVDDGAAGARTISAINAGPEKRLSQVLVNLERLRWQDGDPGPRYFRVNIPDFSVTLRDQGTVLWQSRVVVGELKTRTAEFSDVMTYMVVNPTWHIPDSIAVRSFLPKLQRDPSVLQRQNIRLLTRGGTEINPALVDFTQYTPENFPFRIKQRPDTDNALGKVKFIFPNNHSIYMHDTPHRELFARDARAFSNGCIRLEKPVELAQVLLGAQGTADPAATFDGLLAGGKERRVDLDRPIPVHIEYRTVFVDDAGTVRYRSDIYGRDAEVFRALQAAGVALPAAQG